MKFIKHDRLKHTHPSADYHLSRFTDSLTNVFGEDATITLVDVNNCSSNFNDHSYLILEDDVYYCVWIDDTLCESFFDDGVPVISLADETDWFLPEMLEIA